MDVFVVCCGGFVILFDLGVLFCWFGFFVHLFSFFFRGVQVLELLDLVILQQLWGREGGTKKTKNRKGYPISPEKRHMHK